MKDCNCSAARITYDDFVLIMKGQTRDFETEAPKVVRTDSGQRLNGAMLHAVNEVDEAEINLRSTKPKSESHINIANPVAATVEMTTPTNIKPINGFSPYLAPNASDLQAMDSPLSMDDNDGIPISQIPGLPNFSQSSTPKRRTISESKKPKSERDESDSNVETNDNYLMDTPKPNGIQVRGKSRSFDEREMKKSFDIDSRRAVALPEHDPEMKKSFVNDKQMSALQVNRQLYRSHRQMRLSVIDACKRFEEQQAKHAHGVLLAEKKNMANLGGVAGLVMRRVENKTVSSEEVKNLLEKNRREQQDLMEKANRRSGGRRSRRKKTVSDLSTMMGSLSSEEMTKAAQVQGKKLTIPPVIETKPLEITNDDTNFRSATVPGEFRKVKDPFGSHGKYAAIVSSN